MRPRSARSSADEDRSGEMHDFQRATVNILADLESERERAAATQRATLNMLEDLAEERSRFEKTQAATLNMLEDLNTERARSDDVQRGTVNVLEDLAGERERLEGMQKATLNILDDLRAEKQTTEDINLNLQREVYLRRNAEEAITAKAAELARSNDDLQQFAYVASHDMQEPLRTVSGAVSRLARRHQGQLGAEADEYIRFALEGTARMQTLIEDLLAYSRVGTHGEPVKPTDAESVLARTLTALRGAIEDAGAVVTHDPLPTVLADESQLFHLFQNLVGNAIKFRSDRPPAVHVSAERSAGAVWTFHVRDNGIGIDPQYHERIFVIFQRLHARERYPGTGIGLAIAKKIVERHGGRIWLDSAVGAGTTFHFTFASAEEGPK